MFTTTKPVLSQTKDPEYMIHFGPGWLFPWEIITDPGDSNTEDSINSEGQVAVNEPMTQIRNKYKGEGEDKSIGKEAEEEYMEDNEGRHSIEFKSTIDDDDNIPISSLGVLGRRKRREGGRGKAKEIGTDVPTGNEAKETMEDNEGRPSSEFSNCDDDNDNIPISILGILGKRKRSGRGRGKAKEIETDKSVIMNGSMGDVNVAENDNADDDSGGGGDDDRTQEGQEEERKSIRGKSLRKRRKVSYIDLILQGNSTDHYTTYIHGNDAGHDANEGRYGLDDVSMDDDQKGSGISHDEDKSSGTQVISERGPKGRPRKEGKKSLSDYAESTQRKIISTFGGDIMKYRENVREQSRNWNMKNGDKAKEWHIKDRDKVNEHKKIYRQRNRDKSSAKAKTYYQRNKAKVSEYKKSYYQRNKDKFSERSKAYYQRNSDRMVAWNKAYYQRNRDKTKERQKAYYQRNKGMISEKVKAYRQRNRDKISERVKTYRQRNMDRISQREEAYHQRNKDKISEWNKTYYQKNKAKISVKVKAYRQRNRDKISETSKAYRQRKKEEKVGISSHTSQMNSGNGSK